MWKINPHDFPAMGRTTIFKFKRSEETETNGLWTAGLDTVGQQVHSSPEDVSIPHVRGNLKALLLLKGKNKTKKKQHARVNLHM